MPRPARSRPRPTPRPATPPADAAGSQAGAPPRPARRPGAASGSGYVPPDYSYVGRDVIKILALSAALIVVMFVLSRFLV